jgi:hypothetical protein
MKKSPFNYLITYALGIILWVVTAIFIGKAFSESLMLAVSTPEEIAFHLRVILGIASILGIANCTYWYYYGNLTSTAGNLGGAKRVWWASFIVQIVISVVLLLVLILMNLDEGILTTDWLITFGLISLISWIFFWFCTFFMSPRTVQYIPLFK